MIRIPLQRRAYNVFWQVKGMVSRASLHQQSCTHQVQALNDSEISAALAALPDWKVEDGRLTRHFDFSDYHQTIAFVNAITPIIHQEDHHPEMIVSYKHCTVKYNTHSVNGGKGGLSINDFICAAKTDAVFMQSFS